MKKPIRVFYNELSGRFYASQQYKIKISDAHELVTITGEKFDVTNDIARAIKQHDLEFTPIEDHEKEKRNK